MKIDQLMKIELIKYESFDERPAETLRHKIHRKKDCEKYKTEIRAAQTLIM